MGEGVDIRSHLRDLSADDATRGAATRGAAARGAIAETVQIIADVAAEVSALVAQGPLAGCRNAANGVGLAEIDERADDMFMAALRTAPVAVAASKRAPDAIVLNTDATLAVAIDSLDGASNIDSNISVGTIFSIYRTMDAAQTGSIAAAVMQPGNELLAAGFAMYGPHTALVISVGDGADGFTLDRESRSFVLTGAGLKIPPGRLEYAINASNYWHWDEAVRGYIDACISAAGESQHEDFNMRWIGTLAAETYRVMNRGGVFLYPGDDRPGFEQGRFQLVYEANPIAFLVEQAGGAATDGSRRILDIAPKALHQRVPVVFGSGNEVERVADFYKDPHTIGERSPLFGRRGLFRS